MFLWTQIGGFGIEQIVFQFELFQQHFGVEDIFLIHIHIHHVVHRFHIIRHEILNRVNLVIDEVFHPVHIAGKPTHAIIDGDNIGFQLMN